MIEITNLTKTKINTAFLQKAARAAFAALPRCSPAKRDEGGLGKVQDISLVFVGDKTIQELNKKYRRKNNITDVLSFEELNEIFICLPQAKRQIYPPKSRVAGRRRGRLLKTPLKSELMRLLVHGIVHLKGYDHERGAKQAARMLAVENKILKKLKL